MIDQDYTRDDLKKAMLNEACPHMIGFFCDLVEDFKQIDEMEYGDTAMWFYRKQGTSFRVEDPQGFEQDYNFWKNQVFRAFTIVCLKKDLYRVQEINLKQPK